MATLTKKSKYLVSDEEDTSVGTADGATCTNGRKDEIADEKRRKELDSTHTKRLEEIDKERSAKLKEVPASGSLADDLQKRPESFGKDTMESKPLDHMFNKGIPTGPTKPTWSTQELFCKASGGITCSGVYLHPDIDILCQNRQSVLVPPQNFNVLGCNTAVVIENITFKSEQFCDKHFALMSKFGSSISASASGSYCLMSGSASSSITTQQNAESSNQHKSSVSYACSVSHKYVPMTNISLSPNDLTLHDEVLNELVSLEQELESGNKQICSTFFAKYGSHISTGQIEFGGILLSIAERRGFSEKDREAVTASLTDSSAAAAQGGFAGVFQAKASFAKSAETGTATETISTSSSCASEVRHRNIGGPIDIRDPDDWTKGLMADNTTWRVIKRGDTFVPIWGLLMKHSDRFDDVCKLMRTMEAEYEKLTGLKIEHSEVSDIRLMTEKRKVFTKWIKEFDINVLPYNLQDITRFRESNTFSNNDWYKFMIKQSPATEFYTEALAHVVSLPYNSEKRKIARYLNTIFDPIDQMEQSHCPYLGKLMLVLTPEKKRDPVQGFKVQNMDEYMDVIIEQLKFTTLSQDFCKSTLELFTERIELSMNEWYGHIQQITSDNPVRITVFQYILCSLIFHTKGYDLKEHLFDASLTKANIYHMYKELVSHNKQLKTAEDKHQYIHSLIDKESHLKQDFVDKTMGSTTKDASEQIQFQPNHLTRKMSSELRFLLEMKSKCTAPFTNETRCKNASLDKLLQRLNMKEFFPQKLTLEQVLVLNDKCLLPSNPKTLGELPWFFLRNIIGIKSNVRDSCFVEQEQPTGGEASSSDTDSSDDDSDDEDNEQLGINPLDLIVVIFHCADDILRQRIMNNLVKCRYAVPLVIPHGTETYANSEESTFTFFSECLGGVTEEFTQNGAEKESFLIDEEFPMVSFVSLTKPIDWQSTLLNLMMSDNPNHTFWHRAMSGGKISQTVSENMLELAWYLTGGSATNLFNTPITFTNLRGIGIDVPDLCKFVLSVSSVSCIFIEDIDETVTEFLEGCPIIDNIILIVLYHEEIKKAIKQSCQATKEKFPGLTIIRKGKVDENFYEVKKSIQKHITGKIQKTKKGIAVKDIARKAKEDGYHTDNLLDGINNVLGDAHLILEQVHQEIANAMSDPLKVKRTILPYHSDLQYRKLLAANDKERFRMKKREIEKETDYRERLEHENRESKLKCIDTHIISDAMKKFLVSLVQSDREMKKLFLQTLKLGLNKESLVQLRPIYQQYKMLSKKEHYDGKEKQMSELANQLGETSIGLEHFFREIVQMYDLLKALNYNDVHEIRDILVDLGADILLDGFAMEIMDGDSMHVHVDWVKSVLAKVEDKIGKKRMCSVSVIGAQSCGKSTLLNTLFGLEFQVSSGRCTRGAFMQIIKVDDKITDKLGCDYVMVIDTEGLQSGITSNDTDRYQYDNELSTLIIGLSDITLIVIKGEGEEMKDVIPMAIHAFLRIGQTEEPQACHFVHQNMGSVCAETKMSTQIQTFVNSLNEMTVAAAKANKKEGVISKFTDVLLYDQGDNTYVPGLLSGSPPMAPVSVEYATKIEKLKVKILERISNLNSLKSRFSSFSEWSERIAKLWVGIEKEDFIFSFQNTLAIEAFDALSTAVDALAWTARSNVRCEVEHVFTKLWQTTKSVAAMENKDIYDCVNEQKQQVNEIIQREMTELTEGMENKFEKITNKHLIQRHKSNFMYDIDLCQRELSAEVDQKFDKFLADWENTVQNEAIREKGDNEIQMKIREKLQDFTKFEGAALKSKFDSFWNKTYGNIASKSGKGGVNVDYLVDIALSERIPDLHKRFFKGRTLHQKGKHAEHTQQFKVSQTHIQLTKGYYVDDTHIHRFQSYVDDFVKEQHDELAKCIQDTRPFEKQHAQEFFQNLFSCLSELDKKDSFISTDDFRYDFGLWMKDDAKLKFASAHQTYLEIHDPAAQLQHLKDQYFLFLKSLLGDTNQAADLCEGVLKELVVKYIKDMPQAKLADQVKQANNEDLANARSLQLAILRELGEADDFNRFHKYLMDYNGYTKEWIKKRCIEYFTTKVSEDHDRLTNMMLEKCEHITGKISAAMGNIDLTQFETLDAFLHCFCNMINAQEWLHDPSLQIAKQWAIINVKDFLEAVSKYMDANFKNLVHDTICSEDVTKFITDKVKPHEYIFHELVRCDAKCPFCNAPCDAHSMGRQRGFSHRGFFGMRKSDSPTDDSHSTTLHRVIGLSGVLNTDGKLESRCCIGMMTDNEEFAYEKLANGAILTMARVFKSSRLPYKKYKELYPSWNIPSKCERQTPDYWKWVFGKFQANFAKQYDCQKNKNYKELSTDWPSVKQDLHEWYYPKPKPPLQPPKKKKKKSWYECSLM